MTLEHAVFRKEELFSHSNVKKFLPFWVKIADFLNSFTSTTFKGIKLNSYYPQQQHFKNYVPAQFEQFMMSKCRNG